ncbi:MAG: hypothetical protein PHS77_11410 [Gallionellaceae bacterium]|nr:hypothetical protein [Gallionellaceae bacterium]
MRLSRPLCSLEAAGTFAGRFTFQRRRRCACVYPRTTPEQPHSPAQVAHHQRWHDHAAAWHTLPQETLDDLAEEAKHRRLTAFQVWMSRLTQPAEPGNLGFDEIGLTNASWVEHFIYAQGPYELPANATIDQLTLYATTVGVPPGRLTIGLYHDDAGTPTTLAATLASLEAQHAVAWNHYPASQPLPAGLYHLAVHPDRRWYTRRQTSTPPAPITRYKPLTAVPGWLPDTFPSAPSTTNNQYSHYARYQP